MLQSSTVGLLCSGSRLIVSVGSAPGKSNGSVPCIEVSTAVPSTWDVMDFGFTLTMNNAIKLKYHIK